MSDAAADYSFSPPTVASLVAAGIRSAGRYVGPGTPDKHLHPAELAALFTAGLSVFLLAEGQANDALKGRKLGAAQGASAVRDAQALGAPAGVAIIGNVDFDVTAAQWPACRDYMAGFAEQVRAAGYRVGLYGGYNAIAWGARDAVAEIFFQTYAWSGGRWHPAAQIQQYRNGVSMGGGDVDLCRTMVADFGQWARGGIAPVKRVVDTMYGLQEQGDAGVWLSNGQHRRAGFSWAQFCRLVDAGLVQRPTAGPTASGPYGAFVLIVPKGELDAYGGPVQSGGAASADHTHSVPAATTGPAAPEAA